MMQPPSERDKKRFKRAMQALNHGDPRGAIKLFDKVRKSWGDYPDIAYLEGLAYGKLGDLRGTIKVSKRALKLDPKHFGALCNLANAQMGIGDSEAALENYTRALDAQPNAPEVLDNYGRTLSMLGRREEAIEHYKKAIEHSPNHAPAYAALGKAYAEAGDPMTAMQEFKKALKLDWRLCEAHLGLGVLNCGSGGIDDAEFHFNEALKIDKQSIAAYVGLSNVNRYTGNYDKAIKYLESAEKYTEKDDLTFFAIKAELLEQQGDKEQAYNIVSKFIEKNNISSQLVVVFSRLCHRYNRCDEALKLIDSLSGKPATDASSNQGLLFAAGNLLDKLGRYDEAISYYNKANSVMNIKCDRGAYKNNHDEIISCFSKQLITSMPRADTGSSRPIFVVGMPRSGTTLTEQILATHPDVFGAGELHYIKQIDFSIKEKERNNNIDYLSRIKSLNQTKLTSMANIYLDKLNKLNNEAKFVIDKMPHNFLHIGLIALLFPDARIIHCRRNPLDIGLSIYFQNFIWVHDYAVDLSDIGFCYNEYERIMKHWEEVVDIPIMTIQYEDMIQDQEGMSRKLLEFCGLEWDESVMKFYDSKRDVGTASYDQVRRPIYQTSKERWRNYEKHIGPLMDEIH